MRIFVICLVVIGVLIGASDNYITATVNSDNNIGIVKVEKDDRAVPQKMNLQGYLTTATGDTFSNNNLSMTFKIYRGGSVLWQETQVCTIRTSLFSVMLGRITPIAESIFAPGIPCELELTVVGQTLSPRVEITSVGFAFKSVKSDTASFSASINRPISPLIGTTEISDGAITNPKLADNSVSTSKIQDGTIIRADVSSTFKSPYSDTSDYTRSVNVQYVDSARVTANTHKLQGKDTLALSVKFVDEGQSNSISSTMIADGTIVNNDISATAGISDTKIAGTGTLITNLNTDYLDGNHASAFALSSHAHTYVDSTRIATNAHKLQGKDTIALSIKFVDEGQTNSISTAMIFDGAVTNSKLGDNSVSTPKIQDGAVTSAKIADGTIVTADIADGAITLAKHADNSVNSAKIVDGSIGTVDLNFAPVTRPLSPGISTVEMLDGAVTSTKIVDGAITTPKISDNNVTSAKITDNTITTIDIADNAISTGKIQDGAVTNAKINANAVTTDKIQNYTIKTEDIHSSCRIPNTDSVCGIAASRTLQGSKLYPLDANGALVLNYSGKDKEPLSAIALTILGGVGIDILAGASGVKSRINSALTGKGVEGIGGQYGVWGSSSSANGFGVFGINTNSSGTGVHGIGNNTCGWYMTDGSGGAFTGTKFGSYSRANSSSGTGDLAVGNNLSPWNLTNGSGGAFTGSSCGVYGRANNSSGDRFGAYFEEAGGQYAYVAYTSSGGTRYKVLGGPSTTVSTFMPTQRGNKVLYCPEMPEPYFEDVGEAYLSNGHCRVNLDPTFIDCISVTDKYPLKVFVQVEDDCNGVYVKKDNIGFDVYELQSGRSNVNFSYRVLGKWKGYEHLRFEDAPQPPQTEKAAEKEAKEILPESH